MPQTREAMRSELGCPQLQRNHISPITAQTSEEQLYSTHQRTILAQHKDFTFMFILTLIYNFYSGASLESRATSQLGTELLSPVLASANRLQINMLQRLLKAIQHESGQFSHNHIRALLKCALTERCRNVGISRLTTSHHVTIRKLIKLHKRKVKEKIFILVQSRLNVVSTLLNIS